MIRPKMLFWLLCLLLSVSSAFAQAETGMGARREPFKPLVGNSTVETITPIPPDLDHPGPLQNFETQQLRVTGIILGGLGTYATVLAPDGKTYMLTLGTAVGQYEGTVSDISENAVQVKEIRRFLVGNQEIQKEHEISLFLNPLQEHSQPNSRFVIVGR